MESLYATDASYKNRLHAGYSHPIMREWQEIAGKHGGRLPSKHQIVYPLFIVDGETGDEQESILSMPGIKRFGKNRIVEHLRPLVECGLGSVLLFGSLGDARLHLKDERASRADAVEGPVIGAIQIIRRAFPSLLIICDVCLCAYTSHGHCGILNADGSLNNRLSIDRLAEVALAYAMDGAHIVAPSDMMDHRVYRIKQFLHGHGLDATVAVLSYSAKFASCFYGPFRDVANSAPAFGDRRCYQLPPGSRGLALRAIVSHSFIDK
jgi:porphobilinogen synthase